MLHAVLLVVAHDLLEYRYVDDVMGNLFFLFCSTFMVVIMFVRLFQAKASESLKKKRFRQSYYNFTKKISGETETKRAFDCLRMPKPRAIFTTVAIMCHQYETLAALQNVFAIILL